MARIARGQLVVTLGGQVRCTDPVIGQGNRLAALRSVSCRIIHPALLQGRARGPWGGVPCWQASSPTSSPAATSRSRRLPSSLSMKRAVAARSAHSWLEIEPRSSCAWTCKGPKGAIVERQFDTPEVFLLFVLVPLLLGLTLFLLDLDLQRDDFLLVAHRQLQLPGGDQVPSGSSATAPGWRAGGSAGARRLPPPASAGFPGRLPPVRHWARREGRGKLSACWRELAWPRGAECVADEGRQGLGHGVAGASSGPAPPCVGQFGQQLGDSGAAGCLQVLPGGDAVTGQ